MSAMTAEDHESFLDDWLDGEQAPPRKITPGELLRRAPGHRKPWVDAGVPATSPWTPTPAEQMIEYANECDLECPCGETDWVDGDVTDGGTAGGSPDSVTVHWFDGFARCACGQETYFSDSSA